MLRPGLHVFPVYSLFLKLVSSELLEGKEDTVFILARSAGGTSQIGGSFAVGQTQWFSRSREVEGVQRPGSRCGTVEELSLLWVKSRRNRRGWWETGLWAISEFSKKKLF